MDKDKKQMHRNLDKELNGAGADAVESWRVFRIMSEFVAGFELLRKHNLVVTVFGSARCGAGEETYDAAEELGKRLAEHGFTMITGGGPGVMEAANAGAFKAGGTSVGINIKLPMEQRLNPYTTESDNFHFFFTRKVMLSFAAEVYVYFPGGFGTLDEFFEILTLVQTKKIQNVPIVLFGKKYWTPLIEFFRNSLLEEFKTISKEDLDLFHLVDSVDEACEVIEKYVDKDSPQQI